MQPSLSEQCEDSGRKFQNLSIKRNHIYTQLSKKKDEQCKYSTGSLWKQAHCHLNSRYHLTHVRGIWYLSHQFEEK